MSISLIIVIITAIISYLAFQDENLNNKLILWPRRMDNPAEYYRFLTSGFIHGDWNHLIFNMYALYAFGSITEQFIANDFLFVILYLTGIIIASIPSFLKNRNNSYYRSLGASGGVSAIVFFVIYCSPWSRMGIIFLPFLNIPSILFAVLYLMYSAFMSKRGSDNVNHDAHIWGSLYGMVFAFLVDPTHGRFFLNEIMHPR